MIFRSDGNAAVAPTWSPDGTAIAFSATVGGRSDLFVYDLDTSTLELLDFDKELDTLGAAAASSDHTVRPKELQPRVARIGSLRRSQRKLGIRLDSSYGRSSRSTPRNGKPGSRLVSTIR